MVNRMRATRSHRNNRRSHHALDAVRLSKCSGCGALHQSHKICMACGSYNGRKVLDLAAKVAKKVKARKDAAAKNR
ncbi:MAG: 50S ribosomal protein L32 [Candidatus Taylorbacteria bacterium]